MTERLICPRGYGDCSDCSFRTPNGCEPDALENALEEAVADRRVSVERSRGPVNTSLPCSHCGHTGTKDDPVIKTHNYIGGRGMVPSLECYFRDRCWERWTAKYMS